MRVDRWEDRLRAVLDAAVRQPFRWGSADCLILAGDAVLAITDRDPIADLRGRYSTEIGARRLLARLGFRDMSEAVASRLTEIDPAEGQRGDIAIVPHAEDGPGRLGCGVIVGAGIAVRTEHGLGIVPLLQAVRAFRVEQ